DWSRAVSVKVSPFGVSSNSLVSNSVLGLSTVAIGKCADYIVQSGDTLWGIASLNLGGGSKYQSIMQQNSLKSSLIHTGQTLKVGC
ncbi:MAG TPA: LysM peptidoglycan-binding domain-containing protein, partial [Patescibacteria group bacterium]|nr:LysM peptidoglycan-binding domain-containing protein [Patescibacteria group bacterium]